MGASRLPPETLPPFIAGTEEIVPGNSLQGEKLAIPISWDHTFQAPANCRVRVSVFVAPFVTATGYQGLGGIIATLGPLTVAHPDRSRQFKRCCSSETA